MRGVAVPGHSTTPAKADAARICRIILPAAIAAPATGAPQKYLKNVPWQKSG